MPKLWPTNNGFIWIKLVRRESLCDRNVAHGFLTLSLIPHLLSEALCMGPARMGINYGLNRVGFTAPVHPGKRFLVRMTPLELKDLPGGWQFTWKIVVEIEDSDKPACVAELVSRRYE